MVHNGSQTSKEEIAATGQLLARPTQPTAAGAVGLHPLELDGKRDGFLYVPNSYRPEQPAPLVLMLHGAGGSAEGGLQPFQHLADQSDIILLAIDSRYKTWDMIISHYGPDIAFMDRALTQTFSRYAIDPSRLAIGGFSDGASYALSVGISNGNLFTHVIAFSPGFIRPTRYQGAPRLFVSHGKWDTVLSIDRCSRRIVPQLQQAGYDLRYQEFNGTHIIPGSIAREALNWLTE
ncbi:phospholipase [Leptolyngbya sp. FACHB-36]|uniref:alpha/beta hydrolase n=1 Tax=Leptolyngbya sp. FACHB-36 TaxID=2692808 RepID=UPI0016807F2F|nr:alpha/beta hydrolase-fold protein [Leptolyngbya sp. FACHB-36]MBD2019111.1 phospholipase [Leptolyngbya sp. FACHB-36]